MYAQMIKSEATQEAPEMLAAFQERIDRGEKIEPKDWMPEWHRKTLIRQIGQHAHSEIVGHRERAQRELGEAYDFKAFNTSVIMGGNAPLNVVNNTVTRYIEEARG